MNHQRIHPSPDRAVGPLEDAWLRGKTTGPVEFDPMPCYIDGQLSPCDELRVIPEPDYDPDQFKFPQTMRYDDLRDVKPSSKKGSEWVTVLAVAALVAGVLGLLR